MKNLKTLSLAVLALVASASFSFAGKRPNNVDTVLNRLGNEAHPWNAGYLHARNSTTDELVVCSGRCLLAGVIINSGPVASFITIRNSSVADGSGAIVLKAGYAPSNSQPGYNPIVLPILLDKGITLDISSVAGAEEATVLYRDLD